tara:strand:+ start:969 stop:3476 length:2508 start_codon:yes stop_codon:yes gene_type:complete
VAESVLRFRVETKDANAKINRLEQQVKKLEVAVKGAGGSTKVAGTGFKAFGSGAQAAAVGARGLGAALSTALGPLTAVVAAAASLGQVFGVLRQQDFSEAKVRSLGVNSKELTARLKDVSGELSGQASVLDLTGAAYDVASAGFNNAADASKILKAASQGATGGFSDINTVGDATTSVLNAYGLEADKASKLVDGFIQTQNDGKIVIGEYAANIAKVAPIASALGVPLEEVNAAVAQITGGGEKAEVTFTSLKNAFAQIAGGKVGKEFEKFGVEINAATLKSDGLAGTLEKIKSTGADTGEIIKAFGIEGGQAIITLLGNTEKYNELLENQKNSQGAAAKAAFTASDTIDGQLKRLTTAFQNLFSDQSELGVIIKETFKVAAVTVEVLTAAINQTLAPIRAIFAAVNQVGIAISEALGVDGTDAAFKLEQGFQQVLKITRRIQSFIIGLGVRIGKVIGKLYAFIINGGKDVAKGLVGAFSGLFSRIVSLIQQAYNFIPKPIRDFIEGKVKVVTDAAGALVTSATGFVQETVALGQGFTPGAGTGSGGFQDASNGVSPTGGVLGKGSKSKKKEDQDKEADRLKKIAEAHEKRVLSLDNQRLLASALNEEERIKFERDIELAELARNAKGLSQEQLDLEIQKTLALHDQIDDTKRLKKEQKDAADALKKAQDEEKKRVDDLNAKYKEVGDVIKNGVGNAIKGAIDGTMSLAEAAKGILDDLMSKLIDFAINAAFAGLGSTGGILGKLFGPSRANGGTVKPGRAHLVGERGPELFTPGRTGSITPNSALGGSNIVVNVDASGSNVEGDSDQAGQLGKLLGAAVQAELIKQKRPGGLLA